MAMTSLLLYFVLRDIAASSRAVALRPADEDLLIRIAPGAPPMLAFRYLDGRKWGRFGGLELVLDDAGH